MAITVQDVEKVALLANLELTEDEKDCFPKQLDSIIKYFDELNKLDTSQVESLSHVVLDSDTNSVQRLDTVTESLGQKVALENAPDSGTGHFKVPRVL